MKRGELFLLVGISGSGKSTYTSVLDDSYIVLSSDSLRGVIGRDESDQDVSRIVFATMRTMTEYFLRRGKKVVIDATNYSKKNRECFVKIAKKLNCKITAICFKIDVELAKKRNQERSRVVPNDVIERQYNNLQWPTTEEVDEIVEHQIS